MKIEARPRLSRGTLWLGLWTVFVAAVLWALLRADGSGEPGRFVVHGGVPPQLSLGERVREWFWLAHMNFQRIYPWLLFAPYVAWLTSRFQLERGRAWLSTPVHAAGCILFAVVCHAVHSRVSTAMARIVVVTNRGETHFTATKPGTDTSMLQLNLSTSTGDSAYSREETVMLRPGGGATTTSVLRVRGEMGSMLATNLLPKLEEAMKPGLVHAGAFGLRPLDTLLDLVAYASVAGVAHAVHFYRRYRERERRALFLESNLTQARLKSLQAQLHPHFLFNTLNAIATLLRRDPKAAEATLMSLSDLLRLALSRSDQQEIPLREELRFLERYVEIQRTRFGDRFCYRHEIEPEAMGCLVPTLVLQPLVENALQHGLEPSPDGGTVRVTARRRETKLVLEVEDDGVGLKENETKGVLGGGIGLSNLRARLEALYGDQQRMEVVSRAEGAPDLSSFGSSNFTAGSLAFGSIKPDKSGAPGAGAACVQRGVVVRIQIPWHEAPMHEELAGETPVLQE
jgi:hypothetical protein